MDTALLGGQISLAYVSVNFMQWLKGKSWFPLLEEHWGTMNRVVSAVVAFLVAVGLTFAFEPEAGILTIGGLQWDNLGRGLWAWIVQFAFQQGAFRMFVKPTPAIRETAHEDAKDTAHEVANEMVRASHPVARPGINVPEGFGGNPRE